MCFYWLHFIILQSLVWLALHESNPFYLPVCLRMAVGSGFWTALAMAYAVCFTLQLSFLTFVFLRSVIDAPENEIEINKVETPAPDEDLKRTNDRRRSGNNDEYAGKERRSPTDQI